MVTYSEFGFKQEHNGTKVYNYFLVHVFQGPNLANDGR